LATPIFDMLKAYKEKNRISFSMPGHKNGLGLPDELSSFSLDVTELSDTDNLQSSIGAINEARNLASKLFKSEKTFFLVNGSTGGIYTMLASVCEFGDTILISRACHSSVINACSLLGINPVCIEQELLEDFNIPSGVNADAVDTLINKHNPKAVLIISPNYFGICSDIEKIAKTVHKYNIPLLVDEAHGAHFCSDEKIFPKTAMCSGADLAVQSAHKTLNAVNQTALLHINSTIIDKKRVERVYNMLQTSSPSYLLCASLDYAVSELLENGKNAWLELAVRVKKLKARLSKHFKILDDTYIGKYGVHDIDSTRLVINFSCYNCTGFQISEILRNKYNIDIEMADSQNIVLIPTPANRESDFKVFSEAMEEISKNLKPATNKHHLPPLPPLITVISPYKAFHSRQKAYTLNDAVGKISQVTVCSYPPSIPIIAPGVRITEEIVEYLTIMKELGAEITGLDDEDNILTAE